MNYRKVITDIEADVSELDDQLDAQIEEFQQKIRTLNLQKEQAIYNCIIEEGLLNQTNWSLKIERTSVILLFTGSMENGSNIEKFVNLVKNKYHSDFHLQQGIALRFNDDQIKFILPFINHHKLIVNSTDIRKKLSKMKRDVAGLEVMCHQLKL